jgi:pimeloyl-ACP methyl ester carboxylesterase
MNTMNESEVLPGSPPCEIHHRFANVNGVRLHYVEAQPAAEKGKASVSGKLCLMLHGFPEFWYSWRHQLPALGEAGFHALAPDLRGFNLSDKPSGILAYRIAVLLDDVRALIRHAGQERATVVGHDWGGVIAWHLAMHHPEVVDRLVILNAPHPITYRRELRSWSQLVRSWYIFFFQVPHLPEQVLSAGDYDLLVRMLRHQPVHPDAFTPEDVRCYQQALARPGALTAAINYYRALRDPAHRTPQDDAPIQAPTLLLWGERDAYLTPRLTEGLQGWVPNLSVVRFPDVSHWIQNDAPKRVNRLLIDFLQGIPVVRREPSAPANPVGIETNKSEGAASLVERQHSSPAPTTEATHGSIPQVAATP